jgi:hypothetical protein
MKTELSISHVVDELGAVKSVAATLKDKEEGLKALVIEAAAEGAVRSFEGAAYVATVSFVDRPVTDWKAVQAHLMAAGVSKVKLAKAIADSTSIAFGLPVVRVSARKSS